MKLAEIVSFLERKAHPSLQESYDNCGLLHGESSWTCTGIICSLDATEEVVQEAIDKKCNLIVAHHPIIFKGLTRLNGKNYIEKTVIAAIKNDIAIYAIHTNLDNLSWGVNGKIAEVLQLKNTRVLQPKAYLKKLSVLVPPEQAGLLTDALFSAGAGTIGNYSECSFSEEGVGTFKPGAGAKPFFGTEAVRTIKPESKVEVIFPSYLESVIIQAMKSAHPYEEVAYESIDLNNADYQVGAGLVGELEKPVTEIALFRRLKEAFNLSIIRHSKLLSRNIERIAVCGGAGSFLISNALQAKADLFITSDLKYHEFFDANDKMLLADIGHFESEQFTIDLLQQILAENFPTFAVLKTEVKTNPVYYYLET